MTEEIKKLLGELKFTKSDSGNYIKDGYYLTYSEDKYTLLHNGEVLANSVPASEILHTLEELIKLR